MTKCFVMHELICSRVFCGRYTTDIEAVSCDEMYVNLTHIVQTLECTVDDFVSHIRNEIIEKTKCPCSAGVGSNKLVLVAFFFKSNTIVVDVVYSFYSLLDFKLEWPQNMPSPTANSICALKMLKNILVKFRYRICPALDFRLHKNAIILD